MGSAQEDRSRVSGSRYTSAQRLLQARDFSAVFDFAEYRVSSGSLLILGRRGLTHCARLGLVVSKKKVGNAVKRNRVKRLCREVFRNRCEALGIIDIVIVARGGLNEMDNRTLIGLLDKSFDQLALKHRDHESKNSPQSQT